MAVRFAAALLAAGVLGCGAEVPPTRTQYLASLDAVCRGKTEIVPRTPVDAADRVAVGAFVGAVRSVVRRQLGAVRRLPRPADDSGVDAVLGGLERQLATLEAADPVVATGREPQVAELVTQIRREADVTSTAFRRLGATACALRIR